MTPDLIKPLLQALKLAPRYLVALGIVFAVILFAPAQHLQWLGILDMAKDYRPYIGIGLLLCTALLLVTLGGSVYAVVFKAIADRKFQRHIGQRLARLTEDEKQILRYYVAHQTRSNTLRFDDGVVQGLANARIIRLGFTLGNVLEGFAYIINERVWDILQQDPSILHGSTNTYRTDKRNYW